MAIKRNRTNWLAGKKADEDVGHMVWVDMRDVLVARWQRLYSQRRRGGRQRPSVVAVNRALRAYDLASWPVAKISRSTFNRQRYNRS